MACHAHAKHVRCEENKCRESATRPGYFHYPDERCGACFGGAAAPKPACIHETLTVAWISHDNRVWLCDDCGAELRLVEK
jgi:hypothetical protein